MVESRTKLLDRVLAVALAVILVLAMLPVSTFTAQATSYVAGSACSEAATCGGKLQWVEDPTSDGKHYLVCNNNACSHSAVSAAYLNHNQGEGGSDCLLCTPPHTHSDFTYTVEGGNTLVATCGGAGTCDLDGKKVSITITAPANLEYNDTVKSATVERASEWEAVIGSSLPAITYSAQPKAVGTYTASITVEGKTASVEFTIVKGNPNVEKPTGLTAKYGQTLADVTLPAGFKWVDKTVKFTAIGKQSFMATYTPMDVDNYNVVENIEIEVDVEKADSIIIAPSAKETTQTTITLHSITPEAGNGKVEYGYVTDIEKEEDKNDPTKVTNWQESTIFKNLEGSKTYYFFARIAETEFYAGAVSPMADIDTLDKLNGEVTITIGDWTYGEAAADPDLGVVTGDYTDKKIEYANQGQNNWSETVPSKAGKYTVRVVYEATAVYAKATASCNFEIKQKEVTLNWENTSLTYNAKAQKPTATITAGVLDGDVVTVTVSGEKTKVGSNYTATATLSGDAASNYVIKTGNESTGFKISTKEVTITWTNTSLTHTGKKQQPTATTVDFCSGDDVTIVVSGAQKRPGDYTATATLTGADKDNYVISEATASVVFVISNLKLPDNFVPFTIVKASDPDTPAVPNDNGWYNYDVVIKPAEGYLIGVTDEEDKDFVEDLEITESKQNYKIFLMKKDTKQYTAEIPVGNINIDKDLPTAKVQLNDSEPWDIFLETITFGIYRNEKITVTISGTDSNSGIDHIYHYVSNTGMSLDTVKALADTNWKEEASMVINADGDYVVYAKVVDNAGNVTYVSSEGFVYDDTKPVINVSFDNNEAANETYFKANRTATIVITEHNFNGAVIKVTENGEDTSANYPLNWSSNGDKHAATVLFENEADYTFEISCTDKATNTNDGVIYADDAKATNAFTIDKTTPNVTITIEGCVLGENPWTKSWSTANGDSVRTEIDYNGRWTNSNAKVSATSEDNLSGIDYIEYFRTENLVTNIEEVTWSNTTANLTEGRDAFAFEVAPNEKFIVYAHVVDKAGNDIYLSSNGVIVDDKAPGGDSYSPEIDITLPETNENGFYNDDDTVEVKFNVVEPKYSGTDPQTETGIYSGIKEITYVIKAEDIEAEQTGTFELTEENCEIDGNGLISSWTGAIEIDKDKFNSNNVVVLITAIDNAGNTHTSTTEIGDIKIDVTAPTIHVEYNNNDVDSGKYFKAARTATIVVTERNFNADDFSFVFMKDGAPIEVFGKDLVWNETKADGNGDATTNTATIDFVDDADYLVGNTNEFKRNEETGEIATPYFLYSDLAGNSFYEGKIADEVTFSGAAPMDFTIDKIAPEISVSYNNNSAENEKYFNAGRVATITVVEHNFDSTRVNFMQNAARGGVVPQLSAWNPKGNDTYIATFNYSKDGDYTFDVSMTDMAGNGNKTVNYGKSVAPEDFVIDTTYENMISYSGVENGVAYGHDAEVIPSIKISDINLQDYDITLIGIQKDKTIDLTDEINALLNKGTDTVTGIFDIFETKQDLDGIYTLKMTAKDKAGNEDNEQVVFTVNRFGSVYVFEEYLLNLVKDGGAFVQKVDSDLIITEYNADKLVADSLKIEITVDGKPLENVKYTVTPEINDTVSVGSSGWYQYKYTISKDNFKTDGVYKISISSEDATGNTPENSNYEDKGMTFRVDSTKSEITSIVGLEKAIINAQEVTVKYTIFDTIGIKSILVYVDGKAVNEITDFTADPNNYSGSFTLVEKTSTQAVRIVVEDMAGNITDTDAENFAPAYEFHGSVTVSTNIFVRWYANKGLFWGSIGGVVVVAGALIVFLANKKKKED